MAADSKVLKALEGAELEENDNIYYMIVHKNKQKGFTHFLKNLGFKNINYVFNGSYLIYELNVKNNSYIEERLYHYQPMFLKAN